MKTDALTSSVFETRRDCWEAIIIAGLNQFEAVHEADIYAAACELADGLHESARAALDSVRAQYC
jgi:hypothetical protein